MHAYGCVVHIPLHIHTGIFKHLYIDVFHVMFISLVSYVIF